LGRLQGAENPVRLKEKAESEANVEATLLSRAVEVLAGSGPVAIVLATISWKLWQARETERTQFMERLEGLSREQQLQDQINALKDEVLTIRTESQERTDQLQERMLRLAVRVQRSVEALAGLEPPEIEEELDGDE